MRLIRCQAARWEAAQSAAIWLFWLLLFADCAAHSAPSSGLAAAPPSRGGLRATVRLAQVLTQKPRTDREPGSSSTAHPPEPRVAPDVTDLNESVSDLQSLDIPLPFAERESAFHCPDSAHLNDAEKSALWRSPLARLHATRRARLWASVGPAGSTRDQGRSLLMLARTTESGAIASIACGAAWGVDLEPGDYLVYGSTRTRPNNDSAPGFLYRISQPGDRSCPAALATRGIHDWDGEFPFSIRPAGDLNGDGVPDMAVAYQYAYMNPGTRLLVTSRYPDCYRIVLDEASGVRLLGTRTRGWRDIKLDYWTLHPDPFFGGRMTVSFAAGYDTRLGAYTPLRFERCADGFPVDPADTALRERLCNAHFRAAAAPSLFDQLERWLASAPAERPAWDLGEAGRALLDAIDERGMRWSLGAEQECPSAGNTRVFSTNLRLRAEADNDDTWTREVFVNFELNPRDPRVRVTSISDSSPCPVAPDAPEALDAVSEWLAADGARIADPVLRAAHRKLRRALEAEQLQLTDVRSCASEPQKPTWLWSALLSSGSPSDSIHTPVYLRLGATQGRRQVIGVSAVAPPQCPLR
jgi:hypothetical protein